ncbi:MAG: hypothetical protein ACTS22_04640 [Phycisphaerales bacterium]
MNTNDESRRQRLIEHLDRLGEHTRAEPDDGFEARVAGVISTTPRTRPVAGRRRSVLRRVAAGGLLAAGLGLAIVAAILPSSGRVLDEPEALTVAVDDAALWELSFDVLSELGPGETGLAVLSSAIDEAALRETASWTAVADWEEMSL